MELSGAIMMIFTLVNDYNILQPIVVSVASSRLGTIWSSVSKVAGTSH